MSILTIFVVLLLAAFASIAYFTEPSAVEKRTRERLGALSRRSHDAADDGIRREVTFSRVAFIDRHLRHNRLALHLQMMLEQAKVPWTVARFSAYSAILLFLGVAVGRFLVPEGFVGWVPGILLGFIPLGWVLFKRAGRLRKLNKQLPDAVELMARALRAGHSLPSSFIMVAEEMTDPLGPEFRHTSDELNFGLPFREALLQLQHRYPIEDLRFLITSILLQKETGGNLVELLDKIASLLHARIRLKDKVRVYTAQGRMTGGILIAMPFLCFLGFNIIKPGYSAPLFNTEIGRKMVYGALGGMVLGILSIRKIINIQV
jgi:tight adherence protein B